MCMCAGINVRVYVCGSFCAVASVKIHACESMCMQVNMCKGRRRMSGTLRHHILSSSLETDSLTKLAPWHPASPRDTLICVPHNSGVSGTSGHAFFLKVSILV